MPKQIKRESVDVLIIGGGGAGVTAAVAAKQAGSDVRLVESGSHLGGNMVTGLPLLGCLNARGEWVIGGVMEEFFDGCAELDGYPGIACDYRLVNAVCVDPEAMQIVIQEMMGKYNIQVMMHTMATDVITSSSDRNHVDGVIVLNKQGETFIEADVIVDCTGDGDVAIRGGASYLQGSSDESDELQPVSLMYRMNNVDFDRYLEFVRENPEEFLLAENAVYPESKAECAQRVYEDGIPFFTAQHAEDDETILKSAIDDGDMFPTTAFYMATTNMQTNEVGINATRVPEVNAMETQDLSETLATLSIQVKHARSFLKEYIPGFEDASLSGVSPRIGIRETNRIVGEDYLEESSVLEGRKHDKCIAKGAHHVDIHGGGTHQERIPVADGGSYDIPYGCIIPQDLENVFVAGRHLSSDRNANGSARMLGQCMATGQAAGIAASMCVANGWEDVRSVPISDLQAKLTDIGAILDGTH